MINLDQIQIKDLLRVELNLRELDFLVANKVMKEVYYFKNKNAASINSRLVFDSLPKKLTPEECYDSFGDLKWTKGNNNHYFTQCLPYYSSNLDVALLLLDKFMDYKSELKDLDNDLFEFSYIHKRSKDIITIRAKTAALAICLASLHLSAEIQKK
jgi:hypothetical protein